MVDGREEITRWAGCKNKTEVNGKGGNISRGRQRQINRMGDWKGKKECGKEESKTRRELEEIKYYSGHERGK